MILVNKVVKNGLCYLLVLFFSQVTFSSLLLADSKEKLKQSDNNLFANVVAYLNKESLEFGGETYHKSKKVRKVKSKSRLSSDNKDSFTDTDYKRSNKTDEIEANYERAVSDDKLAKDKADKQQGSDSDIVDESEEYYNKQDPYESYNRDIYYVNKKIDKYVIKPPSQLYSVVTPPPIQYMVSNFFENLQDINVLVNYFLQLDVKNSVETIYRLFLNSTFGIFGLIDVATDSGFPKQNNDFGVTFGKWGATESPYFVIPLIGPSTIRDTIGFGVSSVLTIGYYLPNEYAMGLTVLGIIDKRANLLSAEKIVDTVAEDEYAFVRNAFLDYRHSLILGDKPNIKAETTEEELLEDILGEDDDFLDDEIDMVDKQEEIDEKEQLEQLDSLEQN